MILGFLALDVYEGIGHVLAIIKNAQYIRLSQG